MNTIDKVNIPIYLVSLKQDAARRERLKEQFPERYSDFQHVEAVDGRVLPSEEYFDKTYGYFLKYNVFMSPSELGCALSHVKALQAFLASGKEFGLILEDDVIGTDEDISQVESLINTLGEETLLHCGGLQGLNMRYNLYKKENSSGVCEVPTSSYKFLVRACCYVVSRTSAQQIINYQLKKHFTLADRWNVFFLNSSTKIYYVNVFRHPIDLADSHIEASRRLKERSFLNKLISSDGLYKVARRVFFEARRLGLIAIGYKRLKVKN